MREGRTARRARWTTGWRAALGAIALGVPIAGLASADGATLRVPDDVASVTAAVELADTGDRIEIGPGRWSPSTSGERFPIRLDGRHLVLVGAGPDRTVLDAEGSARLLEFLGGDTSRVVSLALVGGATPEDGGAVLVVDGSPELERVRVAGCRAAAGGDALSVRAGAPSVERWLATGNGADGPGPSVRIDGGVVAFDRCTWSENAGPAIAVSAAGGLALVRSIVDRPGAAGGEAVGVDWTPGGSLVLEDNVFGSCWDGTLVSRGSEEAAGALDAGRGIPDGGEDSELLRALARARSRDGVREGDPLFVDPDRGDYRVRSSSPARRQAPDGTTRVLGALDDDDAPARPMSTRSAVDGDAAADGADEQSLLGPSVPNPSHASTTIHFSIPTASVVDLGVFNVLGQRVRTLYAGELGAGDHARVWDGRDDRGAELPPGIYFVRITREDTVESRRIVLVR